MLRRTRIDSIPRCEPRHRRGDTSRSRAPNIRAAQTLTTRELANALNNLIVEAREGKTQPDRVKNGTFTITNIGVFGVDGG